jgi:hypothetical protein
MPKFRKKPVVIEAERMTEPFTVETMEGAMRGKAGDWLITGVMGEQYPCDNDVFLQTYEPEGEGALDMYNEGFAALLESKGVL